MRGKCSESSIIYQATVTTQDKQEKYIGLTENCFKTKYNNHLASFNHRNKRKNTELSNFTRTLKDNSIPHNINWKIISKANTINNMTIRCKLRSTEKYYIIFQPSTSTLNERRELVTSCRHIKSHLLCHNYKR